MCREALLKADALRALFNRSLPRLRDQSFGEDIFGSKTAQHATARGHSRQRRFGPSRQERFQDAFLFRRFEMDQTSWLQKRQPQTVPLFPFFEMGFIPLLLSAAQSRLFGIIRTSSQGDVLGRGLCENVR
jgi:hypothetical protein